MTTGKRVHNAEYYSQLGKKGEATMQAKIGPDGFRAMGLRGGAATKEKYGPTFYASIGRKGGLRRGQNLREKRP